jgi:hypothetical protein
LVALICFSKLVNAVLLAPHLALLDLLNRDAQIFGNHDILSARWSAAAWFGIAVDWRRAVRRRLRVGFDEVFHRTSKAYGG